MEEEKAAAKLQAIQRGRTQRLKGPKIKVEVPPALVVTGPGGLDKSKLLRALVALFPEDFARPVSHTTRAPRPGEVHGVDYFFVPMERMRTLIGRGLFAEHTEVDGQLYGTSHAALKKVARSGLSCALFVNVDGAAQLSKTNLEIKFVFVAPKSQAALELKLRARGSETEASVRKKLRRSRTEMVVLQGESADFEHVLYADDAMEVADELLALAADVRPLTLSPVRVKAGLSQLGTSSGGAQLAFLTLALPKAQLSGLRLLASYSHLQRLDLSDSRLTSLGPEICAMASLLYLSVDGNRLHGAALTAPLPPSLLSLDASRNALTSMAGVARLRRIEALQLSHNQLGQVAEVEALPALSLLGLGHNLLRGDALALPVSLRALHLEHNAITSLAPLPPLPHLQLLSATHNQLRQLDELHAKCPALTDLRLGHNQLEEVAALEALSALRGLRQLDLRANPLAHADDYRLGALFPLLMLLELDGARVAAEDKVKAMNAHGHSDESLAAIRTRFFPPEGAEEERKREDAAAVALQATFRGHHQRAETQKHADDEAAATLAIQSRFRGNRERELTEAYFNRVA